MFERTMVLSGRRPHGAARSWLPIAALAHAALLAALSTMQAWRVDKVPSPFETAIFVTWSPPPEPREERPAAPAAATVVSERRPNRQPAQPLRQPAVVGPSVLAIEPTGPAPDAATRSDVDATRDAGVQGEAPGDADVRYAAGMTAPAVLARVEPIYPEAARRARREGAVVLEARIGRRGEVVGVVVLRALGFGLDEEAVRAVRQWRFEPARLNGEPVGAIYTITVRYRLT